MKRRVYVVVVLVAAALGAFLWWRTDRLTPDEQNIVGKWNIHGPLGGDFGTVVFSSDRSFEMRRHYKNTNEGESVATGHWAFRNQSIYVDYEHNLIRRAVRPVASYIGVTVGSAGEITLASVDVDAIVLSGYFGSEVWTRESAETRHVGD
jgi:hypothetical protein